MHKTGPKQGIECHAAEGMRELRSTGYLQQNLRHTVGQFLVETLGADWRVGEDGTGAGTQPAELKGPA